MDNLRIRSAVIAFLFGTVGVDMLMLRRHQQILFLLMGGPILSLTVICAVLSFSAGAGWAIVGAVGLVFMEFWALARFFEYLSLSDQEFQLRLEGR